VGTGDASVSVERPADVVWARIGQFGGIDKWMPGVDSCVVDGDVRRLSVFGMDITERLVARDDAARVL
jgi:protein-tyrosine phosphatase